MLTSNVHINEFIKITARNAILHMINLLYFLYRKTKYFYKGRLDWDERNSDGRYVRDNCKSLRVRTL
jgi:hypothetical protein